ncbi:restriction endonuclease subunit S [Vagococcus sp.]|uniref:restriction endonuclease subunit S n=1 Tax=Vagococcus sp. TaxID=1933889 RepID=UPI003F97841F
MNKDFEQIDWEFFSLDKIFTTIQRGKRLTKKNQIKGDIPYISSTKYNNGVDSFIGNEENVRKFSNCLTIANSGSVGNIFYHDYEFIASDHVTALVNEELVKEHYMFLIASISMIGEKYSFNREMSDDRIKREKIKLPAINPDEPDWEFMKEYINYQQGIVSELPPQTELHIISDERELSEVDWAPFSIEDIATVDGGADWEEYNRVKGKSPFIGSSSTNNGVTDFVNYEGRENKVSSGVIGINRNGSVGYAFYHPYSAYFSGDTRFVEVTGYKGNRHVNQFIVTCILKQKNKYAYGYKMGTKRIERQKILLPITDDEKIDYEFMEQYMKRQENKIINQMKEEAGS